MFGVGSTELFIIVLIAVLVIGPKDLPRVMRQVGHWVGKARGMANQFRSGVDQMMRESEIAELEKKWREQNEAIMRAHPMAVDTDWGLPAAPPPAPAAPAPDAVSLVKGDSVAAPAVAPAAHPAAPAAAPVAVANAAPDRPQPPAMAPPPIKPAATVPRG